jgi:FkbM family methyltransferase
MYRQAMQRVGRYLLSYRTDAEIRNVLTRDIPSGECTFFTPKISPRIIDAGAHIGVMTLHFKHQYPNARITSFEPNPNTFGYLMSNIEGNGLRDVEAVNAALSDKEGHAILRGSEDEETRGNSIAEHWGKRDGAKVGEMHVKTVTLSSYLDETVDFLKLDVEGVEMEVLRECGDKIRNVREIELEVHETVGCGFSASDVRQHLVKHGFVIKSEKSREIAMTLPQKWLAWALRNQPRLTVIRAFNAFCL